MPDGNRYHERTVVRLGVSASRPASGELVNLPCRKSKNPYIASTPQRSAMGPHAHFAFSIFYPNVPMTQTSALFYSPTLKEEKVRNSNDISIEQNKKTHRRTRRNRYPASVRGHSHHPFPAMPLVYRMYPMRVPAAATGSVIPQALRSKRKVLSSHRRRSHASLKLHKLMALHEKNTLRQRSHHLRECNAGREPIP